MKVKIKLLNEKAKVPIKAHESDFGYDVFATSCEEVEPGVWKYGLGIAFEMVREDLKFGTQKVDMGVSSESYDKETGTFTCKPNIWERNVCAKPNYYSNVKLSIDFRPRSSIWKTGLVLSNCEGTIDEDYRGEVCAYFYEVIKGKEKYKVGDRIGQIKLGFTLPMEFEEVDELSETQRGEGGFGSTGK